MSSLSLSKSNVLFSGFQTCFASAITVETAPATLSKSVPTEGEAVLDPVPWGTVSVALVSFSYVFPHSLKRSKNNILLFSLVTLNCGGRSDQNCTYFESVGTEVGACSVTICPCGDNICQLRLDFETFVLNQPDMCKFALI